MIDFIKNLFARKPRAVSPLYDGPLIKDGPGNSSGVFTDYGDGGSGEFIIPLDPRNGFMNAHDPVAHGAAMQQAPQPNTAAYQDANAKPAKSRYVVTHGRGSRWVILDMSTTRTLERDYSHKRGAVAAARRMNAALDPKQAALPLVQSYPPRYVVGNDGAGHPEWWIADRDNGLDIIAIYKHKRGAIAAAKRLNLIASTTARLKAEAGQ